MLTAIVIVAAIAIVYSLLVRFVFSTSPKRITNFAGKHVFITGGSTGLGLSLAGQLASQGAKISIAARSAQRLKAAEREVEGRVKGQGSIHSYEADVTQYESIQKSIAKASEENGAPDILILNAGSSRTGYFLEIPVEDLQKEVQLNYMGCVHSIKAALPKMIENGGGHIVFVSSAAALLPFIGYANYSATKCALKGLADALRNELILYNIDVSIFYPSNINTEGFAEENKTKPAETKEIEGPASLLSPDQCATFLIKAMQSGHFTATNEFFPVELMRVVAQGVSSRHNVLMDIILAPIVVLVSPFILWGIDGVVRKKRDSLKKK
ncbi:putative 3-ketodihydrosphingosine reductase [Planoprotostelium fungivorum]|uniref:3-dehydrosphinganine reductase n=1 Tax=Planoprotostelium fungivorum TaxID=1890364 RepID=A0A2P6N709_9EUKA|nr:putative 3-ketodihydrosphingosine reductase [Planoprotostelium fungivorum]